MAQRHRGSENFRKFIFVKIDGQQRGYSFSDLRHPAGAGKTTSSASKSSNVTQLVPAGHCQLQRQQQHCLHMQQRLNFQRQRHVPVRQHSAFNCRELQRHQQSDVHMQQQLKLQRHRQRRVRVQQQQPRASATGSLHLRGNFQRQRCVHLHQQQLLKRFSDSDSAACIFSIQLQRPCSGGSQHNNLATRDMRLSAAL